MFRLQPRFRGRVRGRRGDVSINTQRDSKAISRAYVNAWSDLSELRRLPVVTDTGLR